MISYQYHAYFGVAKGFLQGPPSFLGSRANFDNFKYVFEILNLIWRFLGGSGGAVGLGTFFYVG